MRRYIYFGMVLCFATGAVFGESGKTAYQVPAGLVKGGAYIDRFLPVPVLGGLETDTWGADNVIPRDIKNGIEDPEYSYWGGNIIVGDDGKNHLFVCRWREDEPKGHHIWWKSEVVHTVSDNPLGPYQVAEVIGRGHNPEIYRRADGSYVIGVMGEKAYTAQTLAGPWTEIRPTFKWLDETKPLNKTNRTYIPRADGSVLMVNKNGYVYLSEKGDEHFTQITKSPVYPQIRNHFEDPVIWKDEVQYHLIVNDWDACTAFYMRSPDGINWKWAPGFAYTPEVMQHEGGWQEKWYKFERPKVRQDKYGRVTHMNFAVIDVIKDADKGSDNHSSKNVVIPMTVPRRLQILNDTPITAGTNEILVKIMAEVGFDPRKDIDLKSLKFGAPEEVNFGRGCVPVKSEASGEDLIVTFAGAGNGISEDNFAAKLLGRTKKGALLFGYAALPE